MAENNLTNIQAYQKKWHFNIGLVIFGVIFIYLLVTVLMYLTENHVSAYEVRSYRQKQKGTSVILQMKAARLGQRQKYTRCRTMN